MKNILVMVSGLALISAPAFSSQTPGNPTLTFPGDSVELKTTLTMGRAMVDVTLGNSGPYPFFIDTGASVSVIDSSIASDLGLKKTGSMEIGAPGGNQVESDIVAAPPMKAGDIDITGAELVVIDIAELTQGVMHGILGLDLFREVLLTVDSSGQKAIVSKGSLSSGSPGVIKLDTSIGRVMFDIEVGGRRVTAQIDTGSPSGFTLPLELMNEIPLKAGVDGTGRANMVGGQRTIHRRQFDGTISFAGLDYADPDVNFLEPSPPTANLGSALLRDLVMTIDQANSLIQFTRTREPEQAHTAGPSEPRRLGVRFRGSPGSGFTHVGAVDPGSLGERAGFKEGDELVSLNGKPMSDYDQTTLGSLIRGNDALQWEVMRNGERVIIRIM